MNQISQKHSIEKNLKSNHFRNKFIFFFIIMLTNGINKIEAEGLIETSTRRTILMLRYSYFLNADNIEFADNAYKADPIVADDYLSKENLKAKRRLKIYSNENLKGKDFSNKDLSNAKFIDSNLTDATFKNSDLNNANFENTILYQTNFINTQVENANFKNSRCLTNEQKDFLRDNGAINVAKDLTQEEYEQEVEVTFRTWFESFKKFIRASVLYIKNFIYRSPKVEVL